MKFLYFALLVISLNASLLFAQQNDTTYWKTGGSINFNVSQITLSNWAGGGREALNIAGLFTQVANYNRDNLIWDNSIEIGYGLTKFGSEETRKADDRLIFVSKGSYKQSEELNYSLLLDFRTQLDKGFNYDKLQDPDDPSKGPLFISNLLSPAYLVVSAGMTYKPVDYFQVQVSPIANRLIIVMDEELSNMGAFGVTPGEKVLSQLGTALSAFFKKDIFENINLQSRLNLFSPFNTLPNMVVTWENLINMKVNSWLNVTISTDVIYDEKIMIKREDGTTGPSTQFRNVLALGIGIKWK